jgi:hypothetical protein
LSSKSRTTLGKTPPAEYNPLTKASTEVKLDVTPKPNDNIFYSNPIRFVAVVPVEKILLALIGIIEPAITPLKVTVLPSIVVSLILPEPPT